MLPLAGKPCILTHENIPVKFPKLGSNLRPQLSVVNPECRALSLYHDYQCNCTAFIFLTGGISIMHFKYEFIIRAWNPKSQLNLSNLPDLICQKRHQKLCFFLAHWMLLKILYWIFLLSGKTTNICLLTLHKVINSAQLILSYMYRKINIKIYCITRICKFQFLNSVNKIDTRYIIKVTPQKLKKNP